MCGLVGVFGNLNRGKVELFHQLLIVNVLRGGHSTGVAVIPKDEKKPVGVYKEAGSPFSLIGEDAYYKEVYKATGYEWQGLIGHNRMATIGGITKENAHPFQEDNITLAHNGTLHAGWERKWGVWDTDSRALTHAVARQGLAQTWKELDGAAALSFFDSDNQSLSLITNGQRSLSFGITDDNCVIWASEIDMLEWIVGRQSPKVTMYDCWELPADTECLFYMNAKGKLEFDMIKHPKYVSPPFVQPIRPTAQAGGAGQWPKTKRIAASGTTTPPASNVPGPYDKGNSGPKEKTLLTLENSKSTSTPQVATSSVKEVGAAPNAPFLPSVSGWTSKPHGYLHNSSWAAPEYEDAPTDEEAWWLTHCRDQNLPEHVKRDGYLRVQSYLKYLDEAYNVQKPRGFGKKDMFRLHETCAWCKIPLNGADFIGGVLLLNGEYVCESCTDYAYAQRVDPYNPRNRSCE